MRSFEEKLRDKSWKFHPNYHLVWLVISGILFIVCALVFWLCTDIEKDYLTALYHADVTATLVRINEGQEEKWEYTEGKGDARTPQERETRTYTESVYGYYWDYEIDGKTYTWNTTESSAAAHEIGDTMELRMWSNDGVEYHRSYYGGTTQIFVIISAVGAIIAVYLFVRVMYVKLRAARKKKKKKSKRR